MNGSLRRVTAICRRHLYLVLGSWPRILDLLYWPTVQMILWGFITMFLVQESSLFARASGLFLSAVLLWDTLVRGQLGVALCVLEEMYSRHLGHLFVSPLRPGELVAGVFAISFVRVALGVGAASLLAWPLYSFSITAALGWSLLPFFTILLVFGWAFGLIVAGMVLRLGLAAETIAWGGIFLIQPFSGVFYPISTLPGVIRPFAWLLPTGPVFEGMRVVLIEHRFDWSLLGLALLTLAGWLVLSAVAFTALFRSARDRGLLLQTGE